MPMATTADILTDTRPPAPAARLAAVAPLREVKLPAGRAAQVTLAAPVTLRGTGLHSGQTVRMTLRPAEAGYGIWFRRLDLIFADPMVQARWDMVEPSKLCTKLSNGAGVSVSTVEHLMAALASLGVHNAVIDIDGPEVPILDGSAAPFVRAILARGLRRLDAPLMALKVIRPVEIAEGSATARLEPSERVEMAFAIDFDEAAIGHQYMDLDLANGTVLRELADSRTFCMQSDVDAMRAAGLALGGTHENAVVFQDGAVLTPGGLRHGDEPVRHKMLDAVGDLALAGAPLIGRYVGHRSGHAMTNRLLRALFASPGAVVPVLCDARLGAALPGSGLCESDIALCA